MLTKLFTRKPLLQNTPLSDFVQKSSSAEKRKIYNKVIQQATEEQRRMLERAHKKDMHDSVAA